MTLRLTGRWCRRTVWLLCMATAPAWADPMRPLAAPAAAASAAEGTPALPESAAAPEPRVRRLLAIREDNSGARAALFGDRWLRAGDRYTAPEGETLVLAIGAHHIELEHNKVRSTHHLLAPLLPPQWPTQPARSATGTGAGTGTGTGTQAASPRSEKTRKADTPPTSARHQPEIRPPSGRHQASPHDRP